MQNCNLPNRDWLTKIAKKLATFHSLQVPVSRDVKHDYHFFDNQIELIKNKDYTAKLVPEFNSIDFDAEFAWIKETIDKFHSENVVPIVFSHNDLHCGNMLVPDDPRRDDIMFVDVEFSGYKYRGTDFAVFFNSFMMKFDANEPSTYTIVFDQYPDEDTQLFFVTEYLKEKKRLQPDNFDEAIDNAERILQETNHYNLYRMMCDTLWCLNAGPKRNNLGILVSLLKECY